MHIFCQFFNFLVFWLKIWRFYGPRMAFLGLPRVSAALRGFPQLSAALPAALRGSPRLSAALRGSSAALPRPFLGLCAAFPQL